MLKPILLDPLSFSLCLQSLKSSHSITPVCTYDFDALQIGSLDQDNSNQSHTKLNDQNRKNRQQDACQSWWRRDETKYAKREVTTFCIIKIHYSNPVPIQSVIQLFKQAECCICYPNQIEEIPRDSFFINKYSCLLSSKREAGEKVLSTSKRDQIQTKKLLLDTMRKANFNQERHSIFDIRVQTSITAFA